MAKAAVVQANATAEEVEGLIARTRQLESKNYELVPVV